MDRKVLEKVCTQIRKKYGEESINFLGNDTPVPLPRISTQCRSLDLALGGGLPKGRLVEVYGSESSGKSTLCLHALAEVQAQNPDELVALIDVENSFDPVYASTIGVQVGDVLVVQPDDGTDALNILVDLMETNVGLSVVDSVAALMPKQEADEGLEKQTMGLQARMMSQALRKINSVAARHDSTIVFTNQTREKIGVMWGEKTTTPGGSALKFYASVRIKLQRLGTNSEGEEKVASKVRATITKNKTAPPFRSANFVIRFGEGIDQIEDLLDNAMALDVFEKRGSWFVLGEETIAQGRANLRTTLIENEELQKQVQDTVTKALEQGKVIAPVVADNKNPIDKVVEVMASAEADEETDSGVSVEDV